MTAVAEPLPTPSLLREPAIAVSGVHKWFPVASGMASWLKYRGRVPRKEVLRGIDLTIGRGELLGLLGPNGAGKTTLLKAMATLLLPDRGTIVVDGVDVRAEPLAAKRKIGFCLSEERSFYYRLSARDNLEFFAALHGLRGPAMRRRVEEVAREVDLADQLDARFAGFSSGMRQRLTVARALLGDPPIVILDEPTRAVDPVHAEELRRFIRSHLVERLGKTVVLATNLLEEAWQLCDRIAVVNGGVIVALGPPGTLGNGLQRLDRYAVTLDRCDPALLARVRGIPGVASVETTTTPEGVSLLVEIAEGGATSLRELCAALGSGGAAVRSFTTVEPRPADVFARVTDNRA
jgi:ABC-2 type transport system ATP-binding protein